MRDDPLLVVQDIRELILRVKDLEGDNVSKTLARDALTAAKRALAPLCREEEERQMQEKLASERDTIPSPEPT